MHVSGTSDRELLALGPWWEPHHFEVALQAREVARELASNFPPVRTDREARLQAPRLVSFLGLIQALRPLASEHPDLRTLALWRETLAYESPLADALWAIQGLAALSLRGETSPAVTPWLNRILSGQSVAAFALTEPDAGSDLRAISTRAERVPGGYRLKGTKHLISNAGIAEVAVVLARTEDAEENRAFTAFLVPTDREGLEFEQVQELSEPHPLGSYRLRGCFVEEELRLGEEGSGLRLCLQVLEKMRVTVAAAACGMAARAHREAVAFVRKRKQFGRTLAENSMVQAALADSEVDLLAARTLTFRAAWLHDREDLENFPAAASAAKLLATEAAQRIVDRSVQLLGGRGVLAESWTDRLYRAIRPLRIYEGTSEIHRLLLARRALQRAASQDPNSSSENSR